MQNATLLLPVIKLDNNKVLDYNNCVYSRWFWCGNEGQTHRKPEIAGNIRLRTTRFVRPHIWLNIVFNGKQSNIVLSFCGHGCGEYEWDWVCTGGWTLKRNCGCYLDRTPMATRWWASAIFIRLYLFMLYCCHLKSEKWKVKRYALTTMCIRSGFRIIEFMFLLKYNSVNLK